MTFLDGLATWQLIAVFAVSAGVVVGAGVVLARNGDVIATRTGPGGLFVGMLLMAAATSLPEIVTDTARRHRTPDLALGDLFGSSMGTGERLSPPIGPRPSSRRPCLAHARPRCGAARRRPR